MCDGRGCGRCDGGDGGDGDGGGGDGGGGDGLSNSVGLY